MMQKIDEDYLLAQLGAVEEMLGRAPAGDPIGRMSLRARRDAILAELAELQAAPQSFGAQVALVFGGAPVVGTQGIDTAFTASALDAFEGLVTKVWGTRQHGALSATGPVPDRAQARLHVTGVVHGSFGFELAELEGAQEPGATPLRDAVDEATRAIIAAAESDDALADAAGELDARAFAALHHFLSVLKKARASVQIVTGDLDESLDVDRVQLAAERTDATREEQHDVRVPGVLLGVLPESRTFELQADDGRLLRGRVATMPPEALRALNPTWAGKPCVAHLRTITLTRAGRARERHVLTGVDDLRVP